MKKSITVITVMMAMSTLLDLSARAEDTVSPTSQNPRATQKFSQTLGSGEVSANSPPSQANQGGQEAENGSQPIDNFGAQVSAEAKKLKNATLAARKGFGKSIAAQRRQDQDHRAQASLNTGGSVPSEATGAGVLSNLPGNPGKGPASLGSGAGGTSSHPGRP